MGEEVSEEAPLGAPGAPGAQSDAVAHLCAARGLVKEGQSLLKQIGPLPMGGFTRASLSSHQTQILLHVYQFCEHALKHLDACGLSLGPLRGTHQHDADAAAMRRRLQEEEQQQLPESMAKAGKTQGFFALLTMAEALRALGEWLLLSVLALLLGLHLMQLLVM